MHCGQLRCWNSLVCLGNATDSLLIKMCGDKVEFKQKRRCDGGIEEASPSKTDGPTQTYKLDDATSEASSNRTSAMSRNCIRENGTSQLVVGCWLCCCFVVVLPFTFQNVSLSTHVNFDSVVLSDLDVSARLFALTRCRGLAFIFARVLVRAPVGGPGSQRTDIGDHSVCTPCSRAHFGSVTFACVCHR